MAAWYVLSALGFYPVDACGGEYIVGCPQIPGATLRLQNGNAFSVRVSGPLSGRRFVKSVALNGRPVVGWKISHRDILAGGLLEFETGERQ
jgi:putative alpha-1,2-mannosidase